VTDVERVAEMSYFRVLVADNPPDAAVVATVVDTILGGVRASAH
jgi:hypothetical protein